MQDTLWQCLMVPDMDVSSPCTHHSPQGVRRLPANMQPVTELVSCRLEILGSRVCMH